MSKCGGVGGRSGRWLLLASSSVVALLVGGGTPSAFAGCSTAPTNSASITCIDIANTSFGGNVVNTGNISSSGISNTVPTRTGITISNATIGGAIINAGTITSGTSGNGIFVTKSAAVAGGISNSGTIGAGQNGIIVGGTRSGGTVTITNFSGGISNSGAISSNDQGIFVGGSGRRTNVTISTFAGGISNSGAISAGNGILVGSQVDSGFAGTNANITIATFAGGIGNSGMIAAGGHGIWVGGIVQTGTFTLSTFAGGISNSGVISAGQNGIWVGGTAVGAATITISTFTGGIGNSGTISIGVGGGNGIFVGGSREGGTITIANFSGGIGNSGLITAGTRGIFVGGVGGVGSLTISTFAGGISNSGTIIAATGIVVNSVSTFQGAIVNSGTITGTGGTAIDISGAPNGMIVDILGGAISGNIVGNGTGNGDTVNFALGGGSFAYANTITAVQAVNVVSGTLFDSGSIDAAGVTVESGGTLAPGAPGTTGTLSITGNLAFNSGSAYEIELTPSAHASATVSGDVSINNGTVALSPSGPLGTHYAATTFSILTYGRTLSGAFNPNVTYTGAIGLSSTPTISYVGDNVDLSYGNAIADLATPAGATQNQQNVINGINNAILGGDTIPAGFQQLGNLSGAGYLNALSQLDGEDATSAQTSTFTLIDEFLDLLLGESGDGGLGTAGGGLGFAPDQQANALPPELALAYDSILKAPPQQTFDQRWSTWASGFGGSSFLEGNAAVGSNNLNATTYGSAAGMEYRPDPNTRLGFALAGSGLNWGMAQNLGTGRSDAFQAGVYAKTYFGPAYISTALAFGNNWFTTNRTALGDQLTATFTGQSYAARAEGGYRFAVPLQQYAVIGVTPYAALQTQWFHTPTYSETDLTGGGFGLTYNADTANDTRSELGTRFDDLSALNNKPLLLRASLAWAHDWESGTALNAAFESLPGSNFTVNGAPLPPDSALTTASAQYFFTADLSFTAKFDGEFAPTAQTYAGSGTLRFTW